jgi:hypothetical protein
MIKCDYCQMYDTRGRGDCEHCGAPLDYHKKVFDEGDHPITEGAPYYPNTVMRSMGVDWSGGLFTWRI